MEFTEISNGTDAHVFFSSHCFNLSWDLIDSPNRTIQQDSDMLAAAYTSLWHWQQRTDCTNQNLSVAFWQLSRVHALLGYADLARKFAHFAVEYARDEGSFYLGYGYEALARAEKLAGNDDMMFRYKTEAARLSDEITEKDDRDALLADLATI